MRKVPTPLVRLVLAHAVSLSGNVILTVAVPWLVLTSTGSATLAAVTVFAGVGGATVGALVAGGVVDRIGAVRTGSLAELVNALVVAPLPVLLALEAMELWHVLVLAFLGTLVDSAGSTARQSLVAAAADGGGYQRERANALFTSAEHVAYLLGAPLAGLLIAAYGVGGATWVTVAAFALASLLVGRLRLRALHLTAVTTRARQGQREAIALIWGDPALRALFLFPTVAVMLVAPLTPLVLPVMARETFGEPVVLGVMVGGYGAGGLLGAAAFGMVGARVPRRRLFVVVFALVPSTLAGIAVFPSLIPTLAMLVTLGAAVGALVPLMATVRQERSPAHLLPRVVGLSTATIPVTGPIGVLAVGLVIDALGLRTTLVAMTAAGALIGVLVVASRGVRLFDTADSSAEVPHSSEDSAGEPAQPWSAVA
jgi:predicted MFS family arabinose efflux permease